MMLPREFPGLDEARNAEKSQSASTGSCGALNTSIVRASPNAKNQHECRSAPAAKKTSLVLETLDCGVDAISCLKYKSYSVPFSVIHEIFGVTDKRRTAA